MTDEQDTYGLGAIDSPPDDRDWAIADLYALSGIDAALVLPAAYTAPSPYPPVLNQHATPMCVAYSSSTLKAYEDLRDTGPVDLDEPLFFRMIGGTPNGAIVRNALIGMLNVGYPAVGVGKPERHRIAAYWAVPVTRDAICQAILAFGPVLVSTRWPASWFRPDTNGVLPVPDSTVGGHALVAIGWGARGLHLRNSWGTSWGAAGDAWMPWDYLRQVKEAWKAVDQVIRPPKPRTYGIRIAAHALVRVASVTPTGRISGWTTQRWGGHASSAPCRRPVVKQGTHSGQATVAYVTAGAFRGHWVAIGHGVSVTSREAT